MNDKIYIDHKLPRKEIIRKQKDFREILKKGNKWEGKVLKIYFEKSTEKRVGFSVSKRIGNAVKRNRIKRLMREMFRKHKQEMGFFRILIMAKEGIESISLAGLEKEFLEFIIKTERIQ